MQGLQRNEGHIFSRGCILKILVWGNTVGYYMTFSHL